jgi:uncharacterized membrane protein
MIWHKNWNAFIVVIHHYVIELGRFTRQISLQCAYCLCFGGEYSVISDIRAVARKPRPRPLGSAQSISSISLIFTYVIEASV